MPDIKLGGDIPLAELPEESTSPFSNPNPQDEVESFAEETTTRTRGQSDPNKIVVTIADKKAPLVILFGPPACGKTMSLIRLTRYLRSKNYVIRPDKTFRPSTDKDYADICDGFNAMIDNPDAAGSTNRISFMLVKVLFKGQTLCQILEAPGEHYFDYQHPEAEFPPYIQTIINQKNRKIWLFMVESDETNIIGYENRIQYARKIEMLKRRIQPKDKAIFVFNKIDATAFVSGTVINYKAAREEIKNQYPDIFVPFENVNPITKLWHPYSCDFTVFQTGNYTKAIDGTLSFTPSPDRYPQRLWELILKRIRG